ncbi:hypothetical protein ACRAWD_15260 [Caulobacter segnis]
MLNIRGAHAGRGVPEPAVGRLLDHVGLPIHCDLSGAMKPGEANRLSIRITNPGGRFDWRDLHDHDVGQAEVLRLARLRRAGSWAASP